MRRVLFARDLSAPWQERDQEGEYVCKIGSRSSASDFSAECGEDFSCGADLIRDRDQDRFFISRRDGGQREHVSFDDVFLDRCQVEIALGIFACNMRVMEAVKFLELDVVPVIKEIVVKKRASYELFLFKTEGKDHRQEKRCFGNGDTVVITSAVAVLRKLLELVEMPGL